MPALLNLVSNAVATRMLESTADMPAPPRSPRSPRSPWSAREVELELDDAFSLTERESETFSASSLPTRADLQRMAAWREHGADEDEEDVASQSPMTFRRSLSPSPSPTRLASIPQDDIVELDVAMDAVDLQDKLNGSLALQLDEAESMAVDEPQPETLPVPLPAADEHPYPTVHIDVAHRTVRSISSISGLTEGSQHSHNGSLADSNRATSPPPFASTSQQLQTPSSATSSSFPSAISGPSSSPSSARPQRAGTSHGPSALEKVLSKTRPMHLPPKNKEEDNKHLKDWEDMMYKSRAAGTTIYSCPCAMAQGLQTRNEPHSLRTVEERANWPSRRAYPFGSAKYYPTGASRVRINGYARYGGTAYRATCEVCSGKGP